MSEKSDHELYEFARIEFAIRLPIEADRRMAHRLVRMLSVLE
jgi:hypothetical protein